MFRKDWLGSSKPFGLETTDIRIAGAVSRMETAIERIREYLDGKAPVIEELEEDYFVGNEKIIFASKIMTPSITL